VPQPQSATELTDEQRAERISALLAACDSGQATPDEIERAGRIRRLLDLVGARVLGLQS
jgi:hypothetical protein